MRIQVSRPLNCRRGLWRRYRRSPAPGRCSFRRIEGRRHQLTFSYTRILERANPDPGIRYFSGTATYEKTFDWADSVEGDQILLDLGDVKNLADVTLNGQNLGVLWKSPFRIDISEALQAGENTSPDSSHQPLGQPIDRRCTTRYHRENHVYHHAILSGRLAPATLWIVGRSKGVEKIKS